ncbi:metal ABC transporter permease [Desulforudis sp. 1088]|uniref:metal ABC transporter permease n=1 Tax=unclassified Candidatus Desulforudis TaxID=2635950 RepID=UPI003478A7BB
MEFLTYEFMQRALAAGVMAGVLCSCLSLFVVLQRLSFAGVGISHSALGGIAIGVLTGINPIVAAALFCTGVAWGIGLVSKKGDVNEDSAIGVFFSGAMALGITLISMIKGYYPELFGILFGNILAVTGGDLILLALTAAVILLFLVFFFKELLFICFDEEGARASGLPVTPLYYVLLTAIALTIVVTVKILGIVLASALLVLPAVTAYELTKNFRPMLAVAVSCGVFSCVAGLWLSYQLNLPSGATIVLCGALLFFGSLVLSPRHGLLKSFRLRPAQHPVPLRDSEETERLVSSPGA